MNGVSEETLLQTVYRSIQPKPHATAEGTKSSNVLPEKHRASEVRIGKTDKSMPENSESCSEICASPMDKISDKARALKSASLESTGDTMNAVASPVSSSFANVVVLNAVNKNVAKNETLKTSKFYVLNGNILKEAGDSEKVKSDNVNYICLTNNFGNIIKKIKCDNVIKNGKPLIGSDGDSEKTKVISTVPTFIQLSHPQLKNNNSKIAFTVSPTIVTKSGVGNFEILRSKLLETCVSTSVTSPLVTKDASVTTKKPVDRGIGSIVSSLKKEQQQNDTPAIAKARNELVKCRKALIEAAIHPQLPTYSPPPNYVGPTFTCEECEDTYASADGLNNHKNRRSVLFTYACPVCKKTLEFYNRCMFLLHVRSHDAAVKACFLTISVIPANRLNFRVLDDDLLAENESSSLEPNMGDKPADETPNSTVPKNVQVIQLMKKRKASSPVNESCEERSSKNASEEDLFDSVLARSSQSTELKSDELATKKSPPPPSSDSASVDTKIISTARVSPTHSFADRSMTTIRTKFKKKRLLSALLKTPTGNNGSPDDEKSVATLPIVSSTVTTSENRPLSSDSGDKTTTNTSRIRVVGSKTSPVSATTAAPKAFIKNVEEIYLTNSDEEDEIPQPPAEKNPPVACRECKVEVPNLTTHYRALNRPLKAFPCELCKFFNPSACALSAHVRMHTRSPPFICPDCGFYFITLDSFLIHVKQVCFYDFKTIRFKCPECALLKPSVPQFADHLKRCHIREVFKCSVCITSSYSARVVQTHVERTHPDASKNVLEGYRCMLCPNVLVAKQSINVHVKKHVFGLQHLRYVYICKCCKKYASGRMSKFEAHYHSCPERDRHTSSPDAVKIKKQTATSTMITLPPTDEKRSASPAEAAVRVEQVDEDNVVVERDPLSVEDWEADKLKAEYVPKTKWCVMCRTTRLNEHSRSLFCNACVSYVNADVAVASTAGESDALEKTDVVGRSKRKLKCKLCKQFLNRDWSTITRHYLTDHHADFDVGVSKSRILTTEVGSHFNSGSSVNSRKRKSSLIKTADQPSTTKVTKIECKYRCVKCGYSTNVRNAFHEHIVSHKTLNNTNYQCLECGEGFIVKPSLEKHLMVVHKVRDLNEYYKENKISRDDENEDPKEDKVLSENQCKVCYMECDSKQNYDRHIRTHGMAFVAMQSRAKS